MKINGKEVKLIVNIIVGNEDPVIFRKCLQSIAYFVDEIIVGYNGNTPEIEALLKEFKCNYFKTEWTGKFAEKRKEVWDKSPDGSIILWLDSDDVFIGGDMLQQICSEVFAHKETAGIALEYYYARAHEKDNPAEHIIYTDQWRERIVWKDSWQWIEYDLHESLERIKPGECYTISDMKVDHLCPPEKFLASQQRNYKIIARVYELEKTSNALRPKTVWDYARALEGIGEKEKALIAYKTFLKMDINEREKFVTCGVMSEIYLRMGRFEDAKYAAIDQITCAPAQPDGYLNMGFALFKEKSYKPACVFLEMSFNYKPSKEVPINPTRYDVIPMKLLAICYMMSGKMEKAIKCAEFVLTKTPEDTRMKDVISHAGKTIKQISMIDFILDLKLLIENNRAKVKHLIKALPDWAFDHPTIKKWKETHKW